MSIFTSRTTLVLTVPHDEGQTITIKALAPRHLEAAATAAQLKAFEQTEELGGAARVKQMRAAFSDDSPRPMPIAVPSEATVIEAVAADPLLPYDPLTLIEKAVIAWTYDVEVSRASVEDLDDETVDWLAREVLKLSKPKLFKTASEAKADQKNG